MVFDPDIKDFIANFKKILFCIPFFSLYVHFFLFPSKKKKKKKKKKNTFG